MEPFLPLVDDAVHLILTWLKPPMWGKLCQVNRAARQLVQQNKEYQMLKQIVHYRDPNYQHGELFQKVRDPLIWWYLKKNKQLSSLFPKLCLFERWTVAERIYQRYVISYKNLCEGYVSCCRRGNLEFAQRLDQGEWLSLFSRQKAVYAAVQHGHLATAQWALGKIITQLDFPQLKQTTFYHLCFAGHYEMVKWVWPLGGHEYQFDLFTAMDGACVSGNLPLIQWVYSQAQARRTIGQPLFLCPQYVEEWFVYCFEGVCFRNHLMAAQWLQSISVTHLTPAQAQSNFTQVCVHGAWDVANWLLRDDPSLRLDEKTKLSSYRQGPYDQLMARFI